MDEVWAKLQAATAGSRAAKFDKVWSAIVAGGAAGIPPSPTTGSHPAGAAAASLSELRLVPAPATARPEPSRALEKYGKPAADAAGLSEQQLAAALQPLTFALRDDAPSTRRRALEGMLALTEVCATRPQRHVLSALLPWPRALDESGVASNATCSC